MRYPENTATVRDPRGFAHYGHLAEVRSDGGFYYFPGDFVAGDGFELLLDPWTASSAEALADYLSCEDEEWTAVRDAEGGVE